MPNGRPGDHPLTDILIHGMSVYSRTIDALVREIAALGGQLLITDTLLSDFNEFGDPDLAELERALTEIRDRLQMDAGEGG